MKAKDLMHILLNAYSPEDEINQDTFFKICARWKTQNNSGKKGEQNYEMYIRPWKFRNPPRIFTGSLDNPTEKDKQAEHDTLHNDEDVEEQLGKEIYSGGLCTDISAREEGYPNRKEIINLIEEKLQAVNSSIRELYDELYELKITK